MKKILILFLLTCAMSCMMPYSSYDYAQPVKPVYYPTYYQPTKVIVINKNKHTRNKRHTKVKINKHRRKR